MTSIAATENMNPTSPMALAWWALKPFLVECLKKGEVFVCDPHCWNDRVEVDSLDALWEELTATWDSVVRVGDRWFRIIVENGLDALSDYGCHPEAEALAQFVRQPIEE